MKETNQEQIIKMEASLRQMALKWFNRLTIAPDTAIHTSD
jgi:hypothetical protein